MDGSSRELAHHLHPMGATPLHKSQEIMIVWLLAVSIFVHLARAGHLTQTSHHPIAALTLRSGKTQSTVPEPGSIQTLLGFQPGPGFHASGCCFLHNPPSGTRQTASPLSSLLLIASIPRFRHSIALLQQTILRIITSLPVPRAVFSIVYLTWRIHR